MTRRQLLVRCSNGFGAVALTSLMTDPAYGSLVTTGANPQGGGLHHPAKAKNVIFLYQNGGPSQLDTFDPKPRVQKEHGQPISMTIPPLQFVPLGSSPKVLASPFRFTRFGQCGQQVSEIFPLLGTCVDDMCFIKSMTAQFAEHANANLFLHTCFNQQGRPSLGSWVNYGLGSESKDLPGYVVLKGSYIPAGGPDNFGNGFLPAIYQGSVFRDTVAPVPNLEPPAGNAQLQQGRRDLLKVLDQSVLGRLGNDDRVEAAISNYELAFRMQGAIPDLLDIRNETAATKKLYGIDEAATNDYGRQCLMARRLVERGVRFVEVGPQQCQGANRWDQHDRIKEGHTANGQCSDRPISGLIKDLKSRGLLETTLIVCAGEFGRTPCQQSATQGRDHNPYGYTIWMAGGGVKGGTSYGATDEYGFRAVENRVEMFDLHATILHLLGIDHKRLTYRFGGRDMRLTDVHGEVVQGVLA